MSTRRPAAPRAADIKLDVEIDDKGSRVLLTDRQVGPIPFNGRLSTVNLATRRRDIHIALTAFVKQIGPELSIGGPRPEPGLFYEPGFFYKWRDDRYQARKWGLITEGVRRLYALAYDLADDLFRGATREVAHIFQNALKVPQSLRLDQVENLPLIEVNARVNEFVPIEFLMLLEDYPQPPEKITKFEELENALRPFVGFANAVVKRNIDTRPRHEADELHADPLLPVKLFAHPRLWKAGKSLVRLKKNNRIELDDTRPKPESIPPGGFPCHVAEHLWVHDGRRFDGTTLGRPFQVQHFACHFETGGDDPMTKNSLILDEGDDRRVSLSSLKGCRQRQDYERYMQLARPLVFLNACGSAVVDPANVTSLLEFLMDYGSCGFIGTEALVPEEVAEAFAGVFYEAFLAGRPLGLAIQTAKRRLLEEHQNPLGILYTVYANPDMMVWSENAGA